ncbi:zinc-ribbon domain-containing protein [Clostridium bovifaecis]|uniref:Zinc-ribbon domain-containing protein n=1 Tax=Clostridium bovifaecis TaxID=2184719 RepID=A0A6I6EQ24_9CLOT|nr:zinc-ribbon domain-containing protein [Clostridium bovifaecis]
MFFLGVFGISNREKEIRDISNIICKKCNSMTTYKMIKTYNIFHIFFIPIIKWKERYYLKSRCCGTIFEVPEEVGKRLEQGENEYIEDSQLHEVYSNYREKFYDDDQISCRRCGNRVKSAFTYCPNCGEKLK